MSVLTLLASALGGVLIAGCAHHAPRSASAASAAPASQRVPVAHYSRYTLIEMSPEAAQTDLLQQVVDVRIPAASSTSVGDTVRYVLLHTGYRLCEDEAIRDLDRFPLPAAHIHVGPLPLASALQLLAGRGWQLQSDEGNRRICFARRESNTSALTPSTSSRRSEHSRPALASTGATP